MTPLPFVTQSASGFWVATVKLGAGPFRTNAEAWAWADQHSDEGRADTDRYNRLRVIFANSRPSGNYRRAIPAKHKGHKQ
jgi:hypothetical protein